MLLLLIAIGGAAGALARYAIGGWVQDAFGATFPWGTLVVNVSGAFLLGFVVELLEGVAAPPHWRGFLAIGFCGAYTTLSTLSFETARMMQDGEWLRAASYMAASMFVSLLAVFIGFGLAGSVLRLRG